jgi:hypothetical protein
MAFGLGDILQSLQQGVQAINSLNTTIKSVFPQIAGTSTSAPAAGTITFSSSLAAGFQLVTLPSGQTVRVPYY